MWINAENIINKFSLCVGFTTRPDMMRAIQIIKDEPSIDIVFCKDCKFWKKINNCMSKRSNGYCDEGKRREP